MKSGSLSVAKSPLVVVLLLLTASAVMSASLSTMDLRHARPGQSVARRLFGKGASLFSRKSSEAADSLFHGGREMWRKKAFKDHPFQRLKVVLSPVGHTHLVGQEALETLPWFRAAIALDPHDEKLYRSAAYVLGQAGYPEKQLELLREGQAALPRSHGIQIDKGRIYIKAGQKDKAWRAFYRAKTVWPGDKSHTNEQVQVELREIVSTLALIAEVKGDREQTMLLMAEMMDLGMKMSDDALVNDYRERLDIYTKGGKMPVSAEKRWERLQRKEYKHVCEFEMQQAAGEDDGHDDGHVHHEGCDH